MNIFYVFVLRFILILGLFDEEDEEAPEFRRNKGQDPKIFGWKLNFLQNLLKGPPGKTIWH